MNLGSWIHRFWNMIDSRLGMIVILAITTLLILWALERRSKSAASKISLDDLLLGDDGKMSKTAAVMFGAFALTTWTIVYLTITEKLTEGYFGAYLTAWVAPAVARIIKGQGQSPPASGTP